MDERELRDVLKAGEVPAPDENARKRAINLALAAYDEAQQEKEKKRQGVGFLARLTGRISPHRGERPMNTKLVYGGMATAMTLVLAVITYRTMPVGMQDVFTPAPPPSASGTAPTTAAGTTAQPQSEADEMKREASPARPSRPVDELRERQDMRNENAALPPRPNEPAAGAAGAPRKSATAPESATVPQATPALPLQQKPLALEKRSLSDKEAVVGGTASRAKSAGAAPASDLQPAPQYQDIGRDQFASVDENPVKRVAQEPVSTFSVDVDTASYAFVRRMLMRGVLPQKDAVRVEELINYFQYDYPLPDTREQPFRPSITVMDSPWKKGNKLVQIGVKGYDIKADEKPRSNLVFLLDVSGSMNAPDKLPLLINSMKLLLDSLKADDTVAIVTYAGAAGTVLEPTRVEEKQKILAALEQLRAGGSTAGAAGIRQAYALAERTFDSKAVNRVILATDGDFNVGITNREELKGFIERKRKSGVFLSVLGFGQGNLNDRLMQDLAQNGNGVAAHIDTLNEARKVLVDEATGMLFPIAKDVKIQVEFNPETVAEYRLIGYETRALKREDFNNDKVDAGDIGAGHTVTAIYEITPVEGGTPLIGGNRYPGNTGVQAPSGGSATSGEYGFLKIRYKLPAESVSKLITAPITIGDHGDDSTLAREARWAAAVAAFGQILKGGKYTGDYSYDDVTTLARGARGEDPFGYRAEFLNLVRLAGSASALPQR